MSHHIEGIETIPSSGLQRCIICAPEDGSGKMPLWPPSTMKKHLASGRHRSAMQHSFNNSKSSLSIHSRPVPSVPHESTPNLWTTGSNAGGTLVPDPTKYTTLESMDFEQYISASDEIELERDHNFDTVQGEYDRGFPNTNSGSNYQPIFRTPFEDFNDIELEYESRAEEPHRMAGSGEPGADTTRHAQDQGASTPHSKAKINSDTYPWPNLVHFYTHMLFRSLKLGLSLAQKKGILHWATLCGMREVPTLYSLEKCEEELRNCGGDATRKFTTSSGDILYMNSIRSAMQQDFSNTHLRGAMKFYPSDGLGGIEEIWDGERLTKGEHLDLLTPMVISPDNSRKHYYVNELCELGDGNLFMPKMFFSRGNELWAKGYSTSFKEMDMAIAIFVHEGSDFVSHPVAYFRRNVIELLDCFGDLLSFEVSSASYGDCLVHPMRSIAAGRAVYSVPLIVFQDDVSANRSKQWNKHHVIYISNASLPRKEMNREVNVRFIGSSPHAKPLEMMACVISMCNETFEEPVVAWDAVDQEEVLVQVYWHCISADNQMHVEHCSSTGMNSNYFCRACMSGGPQTERVTLDGFMKLLQPGDDRVLNTTIQTIEAQWKIVLGSEAMSHLVDSHRDTGIKDPIAQPLLEALQTRGIKLLSTRIEGATLSRAQVAKILEEEHNANPPAQRMNPLLHLRGFDVHKDTPIEILHTVLLGVLKYYWQFTCKILDKSGIENFKFKMELKAIIDDLLHAISIFDPWTITAKAKLHILTHAPYYARRFGPLLGLDSERYESYNSNFRLMSVLSTRLAPSLDAARAFARVDRFTHVVAGGWWYSKRAAQYIQAGPSILKHMRKNEKSQELLGMKKDRPSIPGRGKEFTQQLWDECTLAGLAPRPDDITRITKLDSASYFTAQNGNKVSISSNVIIQHPEGQLLVGRVVKIVATVEPNSRSYFIYCPFSIGVELDKELQMPILTREAIHKVGHCTDVICVVNLQHHCAASICDEKGSKFIRQEREQTAITMPTTQHGDDIRYLLNTFSMTNSEQIRALVHQHGHYRTTLLSPADYPSIRDDAAKKLNQEAHRRAEKRKQNQLAKAVILETQSSGAVGSSSNPVTHGQTDANRKHSRTTAPRVGLPEAPQQPVHGPTSITGVNDASGALPLDPQIVLPEGWSSFWDPQWHRHWFKNNQTGECSWDPPQ
ncbi:unnamed protein product [Rhizoctonia solani]|uniref:WW domain-containing protein n=1 Tax=Rhizoctonia solani TaxID=456999 RepID=A0A8H3HCV4_9AGAM|nr:unnamed protein product [Rhizoctonia solani]CAE6519408.1 unnamed protein product [Rhizoctonia solani]